MELGVRETIKSDKSPSNLLEQYGYKKSLTRKF